MLPFGGTNTEDSDATWKYPDGADLHHFFANCLVENKSLLDPLKPITGLSGFADNARPPGPTLPS
jgi:hypothetical protein